MRALFIGILLLTLPLVAACETFLPTPASIGCTKAEENECRVVTGALIIKAANVTIGEQLDRGVLTVAEASRLRAITKRGEDALDVARTGLTLAGGDMAARLAALDAILLQILREQAIKAAGV